MWLTVVDSGHGEPTDVFVDADPAATVRAVLEQLSPSVGPGAVTARIGVEPEIFSGGVRVDLSASLKDSPLRDGGIVGIGAPPAAGMPEPAGLVEIRVVGGRGAGVVHRLGVGSFAIGSDASCAVVIDAGPVASVAFFVDIDLEGNCGIKPDSATDACPLLLEGVALTGPTPWQPGAALAVGGVLLQLALPTPIDAAVLASDDGAGLDYNRPPRLLPPIRQTKFRLPVAPGQHERRPIPILMALTPMLMAGVMAFVYKRYYYLLIAVLSPLMMVGNNVVDRRRGKKSHRKLVAEYEKRKTAVEAEVRGALHREREARRGQYPDPAELLLTATGPRRRLWERRRHDADHLLLRLGTAELDSEVILVDPSADERKQDVARRLADIPVSVSLRDRGVLGIAGTPDFTESMARWVVAQLATLHSPADVRMTVLTERDRAQAWNWVRWLPHFRSPDDVDAPVTIGNDSDSVGRRLAQLSAVLTARLRVVSPGSAPTVFKDPDLVVVLDGARRLRSLPGVVQLLRDGPRVGMYFVCVDADERLLPEECQALVAETAQGMQVREMRADTVDDARPDLVSAAWCERVARALSPIRDTSGAEEEATLPAASRLLDVLNLEPPTAEAILARWVVRGRTTEAVVGESYDGPYAIDLRRDGPHGLVAGTTGSGKSEFLQTLVASLAVANRPDAMTFVLVDYKGGSAFKDCVQLPHTVGMVTDLDAHLVERALESLGAELRRREHILAGVGAKDIDDYVDLVARDPSNPALPPMPRLLIVIDEFASMARDLPDFVTGLVNIAQRGRSLGIHLVLATQRPSGVVSPEIRANSNLRIALRVTDSAESADVIDAPDAARISKSTPGRAYVRLGHGSLVPFQAGRVGGRRPGAVSTSQIAPWVVEVGWADLGKPLPPRPVVKVDDEDDTDLRVLVGEIREAARRAGVPAQPSPWLAALPTAVLLDDIATAADGPPNEAELPPIAYGIEDLPAEQAQRPAFIDFTVFGHLLAGGAPRTGRSQLLRTIAGAIARAASSADVHIYGIDCGNGALLPLTELPHCGAVVSRTQPERAARLIQRLSAEVAKRQELLSQQGFAAIGEQRSAATTGNRLAHIVVLLDRWEGYTTTLGEIDNGRLTDELMKIFREGASVGVHLVVTGDRSLLSGRISAMTEERLAFRLADKSDYSYIGMNARKAPDDQPPGRAFRADSLRELQVALLDADASGQGQAAALASIGAGATKRDAELPRHRRPFRVDVLPAQINFDQAWALRDSRLDAQSTSEKSLWALLGVGGDDLTALGADLAIGTPTLVIGGPPRSGRSTAAAAVARSLLHARARLLVVTPRVSPLTRAVSGQPGVTITPEGRLDEEDLAPLLEAEGPLVVIVDDAESLRECGAAALLRQIVLTGAHRQHAIVLAGNADGMCSGLSGWQVDVKKGRRGLLLSPQGNGDGDLIGVRLPRSSVGGPIVAGRGLLHLGDNELVTVQVPLP